MRKLILFLLLCFVVASCEPEVSFKEPQPVNSKSLTAFPVKLRGIYTSQSGKVTLYVNARTIWGTYINKTKMHKNELDSGFHLEGNFMINEATGERTAITIEADTIVTQVRGIDTLFQLGPKSVLKKFKGYYFVSTKYLDPRCENCTYEDGFTWLVRKISLTKGVLTINSISKKEEIDQLRVITESLDDTVNIVFNPTKNQFRDFIKNSGFSDEEKYIRVNSR